MHLHPRSSRACLNQRGCRTHCQIPPQELVPRNRREAQQQASISCRPRATAVRNSRVAMQTKIQPGASRASFALMVRCNGVTPIRGTGQSIARSNSATDSRRQQPFHPALVHEYGGIEGDQAAQGESSATRKELHEGVRGDEHQLGCRESRRRVAVSHNRTSGAQRPESNQFPIAP